MMLKGLLKLSWLETKIFMREPMGVVGSLALPVLMFVFVGRALRPSPRDASTLARLPFNIAILTALLISLGAVQSLVAIMAIYREGGILKRLRATPLAPVTILGAHVLVKLAFTLVALTLMVFAGRRVLPGSMPEHGASFIAAVLPGGAAAALAAVRGERSADDARGHADAGHLVGCRVGDTAPDGGRADADLRGVH